MAKIDPNSRLKKDQQEERKRERREKKRNFIKEKRAHLKNLLNSEDEAVKAFARQKIRDETKRRNDLRKSKARRSQGGSDPSILESKDPSIECIDLGPVSSIGKKLTSPSLKKNENVGFEALKSIIYDIRTGKMSGYNRQTEPHAKCYFRTYSSVDFNTGRAKGLTFPRKNRSFPVNSASVTNLTQNPDLTPRAENFPKINLIGVVENSMIGRTTRYFEIEDPQSLTKLFGERQNMHLPPINIFDEMTPFFKYLCSMNNNGMFMYEEVDEQITRDSIEQKVDLFFGNAQREIIRNMMNKPTVNPHGIKYPHLWFDIKTFINEKIDNQEPYLLNAADIFAELCARFNSLQHVDTIMEYNFEEHINNSVKNIQRKRNEFDLQFYEMNSPKVFRQYALIKGILQSGRTNAFNKDTPAQLQYSIDKIFKTYQTNGLVEPIVKNIIFDPTVDYQGLEYDDECLEEGDNPKRKPAKKTIKNQKLKTKYLPLTFIFHTNQDISDLLENNPPMFFVDGTRENCPIKNFQLIAVHYRNKNGITQTPFLILTNTFAGIEYAKILSYIESLHFPLKGKTIKTDFELAWLNAAKKVQMSTSHCYFHYAKIIGSRKRRFEFIDAVARRKLNPTQYNKKDNLLVRSELEELLKLLIFIPKRFQLEYINKKCRSLDKLLDIESDLIDGIEEYFTGKGKFSEFFYLKGSNDLTNNVSENFFSQFSKTFKQVPSVNKFMNFVLESRNKQTFAKFKYAPTFDCQNSKDEFVSFIESVQSQNATINKIVEVANSLFDKENPKKKIRRSNTIDVPEKVVERKTRGKKLNAVYEEMSLLSGGEVAKAKEICKELVKNLDKSKTAGDLLFKPWKNNISTDLLESEIKAQKATNEKLFEEAEFNNKIDCLKKFLLTKCDANQRSKTQEILKKTRGGHCVKIKEITSVNYKNGNCVAKFVEIGEDAEQFLQDKLDQLQETQLNSAKKDEILLEYAKQVANFQLEKEALKKANLEALKKAEIEKKEAIKKAEIEKKKVEAEKEALKKAATERENDLKKQVEFLLQTRSTMSGTLVCPTPQLKKVKNSIIGGKCPRNSNR